MARRRTIGTNPLDALLESAPVRPATPRPRRQDRNPSPAPAASTTRVTCLLPATVADRARNAVVALSSHPDVRLTFAALVRDALVRELDRLERAHHQGEPFPARAVPVPKGRPIR